MSASLTKALVALAIGFLGGAVFFWLHLPLPWLLGSLSATGMVAMAGGRWIMPGQARRLARPVVGVLAGSAFTPELLDTVLQWWDAVLVVIVFSSLVTGLGYAFFRVVGKLDPVTAFFASAPGGLGELALMGGSLGGSTPSLVLVHSIRIVVAVFVIPLLLQLLLGYPVGRTFPATEAAPPLLALDVAVLTLCAILGFGLSRVVTLPAGVMLFPLVLSALVHVVGITEATPPAWLVTFVQVAIGAVVGGRFAGMGRRELRHVGVLALFWAATLVALAAAAAVAAATAWLTDRPFAAMLLALAPGGMAEMTVITFSLGIEVAFVVTCQLCRILLVLVAVPLVYGSFLKPCVTRGGRSG